MNNIINSHSNMNNNALAASKLSNKDTGSRKLIGEVRSPDFFPSYSVEKVLKQQDEFRKSIAIESYKQNEKLKRKNAFVSFIKTVLYVCSIYLIISKVKIK